MSFTIICFVENRLNGFQLFGTADNGKNLPIYSDPPLSSNRSEILLDSTNMLDVAVKDITILIPSTSAKILTLCEVSVYGKIDI